MKKALIIIAILAIVGGAGYLLFGKKSDSGTKESSSSSSQAADASTNQPADNAAKAGQQAAATITYSNDGFSPATITVKTGDTVVIKNDSSRDMQFDSDPHPAHTNNEELNVGVVEPGKSMSFVVKRTGTFGYHNHLNASDTGTIVVQ